MYYDNTIYYDRIEFLSRLEFGIIARVYLCNKTRSSSSLFK